MSSGGVRIGLDQGPDPDRVTKRPLAKTMPARMGAVWKTVEVVGRHYETNPSVCCLDCSLAFAGVRGGPGL